jgi:3-oxoacyl-[acyl-carrier-protein] synthase-1
LFADVSVDVVPRGPAGAGHALAELDGALATGAIDVALLGGAHTDYEPRRIAELAGAGRLFRSDRLDALIPGEAAAFVALVRPDVARRLRLVERTRIVAVASGHEQARPDNDASAFAALGLTAALRSVLTSLGDEDARVGWMLTDLTFETFRHFELQAATLRTQKFFCDPQRVDSPAQRMGHLGAAAMPLHLVLASEAFRRGFAPHARALSIAGSDGGERAVMLLVGRA